MSDSRCFVLVLRQGVSLWRGALHIPAWRQSLKPNLPPAKDSTPYCGGNEMLHHLLKPWNDSIPMQLPTKTVLVPPWFHFRCEMGFASTVPELDFWTRNHVPSVRTKWHGSGAGRCMRPPARGIWRRGAKRKTRFFGAVDFHLTPRCGARCFCVVFFAPCCWVDRKVD